MYEMEELLPIVAKLTERYTSGESTSVTYERARELMGAVQYCIQELQQEDALAVKKGLTAEQAYALGLEKVKEKVRFATKQYARLMQNFDAYGNRNYQETVVKALSGFLVYYNVEFEPQENVITMDYPTIISIRNQSGVDAIARYLSYILLEQRFLQGLSHENVIRILEEYDRDYGEQFYNIARVVLRRILLQGIPGDKRAWIKGQSKEGMKQCFHKMLEHMISNHYESDREMQEYLAEDMDEFVWELKNASQNDCIEHLFHITGNIEG